MADLWCYMTNAVYMNSLVGKLLEIPLWNACADMPNNGAITKMTSQQCQPLLLTNVVRNYVKSSIKTSKVKLNIGHT